MKTNIYKDARNGWSAETIVDLGDKRILKINTSKRSDKWIWTYASVHTRDGNALVHRLYEDYNKALSKSGLRCTAKNIVGQHNAIVEIVNTILADVHRFYNSEPALVA